MGRDQLLIRTYETSTTGAHVDVPVAVLVNQNTASAAEIVAACLQDHGRALIVGERSYGKGTVQQLLPLGSGKSLLKLTSASFWRPSGANINRAAGAEVDAKWGVAPDAGFERPLSPDEYREYQSYRDERDGFDRAERTHGPQRNPTSSSRTFVDKPLQLAAKYLQSKPGRNL